jgi:hypothetical protein
MPLPPPAEASMVLSAEMPLRIINRVRAIAKEDQRSVSFVVRGIMEAWYASQDATRASAAR